MSGNLRFARILAKNNVFFYIGDFSRWGELCTETINTYLLKISFFFHFKNSSKEAKWKSRAFYREVEETCKIFQNLEIGHSIQRSVLT